MVYPTPLPVLNPFQDRLPRTAYQHCLRLEAAPIENEPISTLISARLLGHLLHQLHITAGLGGVGEVAEWINKASSSKDAVDAMQQLAFDTIKSLIKPFRRASGPTPAPSEHISREFKIHSVSWKHIMREGNLDHCTAKKYALRRDQYRCVISGALDIQSEGDNLVAPMPGELLALTEAAHIIPESANANIASGSAKVCSGQGSSVGKLRYIVGWVRGSTTALVGIFLAKKR